MDSLSVQPGRLLYRAMIGVGGIGAGSFFALNDNRTLGREESRLGHFLDRRDYCKLHIISHYVQTLLGPAFRTIPIGAVGADETGRRLFSEMEQAGLLMRYVRVMPGASTLFSFCIVYPDGSVCNVTTDNSACSRVDPGFVRRAAPMFAEFAGRGIALAAPEVALRTRKALLDLGTEHGFLRVASFTVEEMPTAARSGLIERVDLLAVNLEEAAAVPGRDYAGDSPEDIVRTATAELRKRKPDILLSVTAGAKGSWCWDGSEIRHTPICKAEVIGTAGAGDAHLAGVIVALATGLSLDEAHQLGALAGGLSVTSPHTINKGIHKESLSEFAGRSGCLIADGVRALLEG